MLRKHFYLIPIIILIIINLLYIILLGAFLKYIEFHYHLNYAVHDLLFLLGIIIFPFGCLLGCVGLYVSDRMYRRSH